MSASSRRPIRAPTLDFRTVVILSTIKRHGERKPLPSFGATGKRIKGASVGPVVKAQTVWIRSSRSCPLVRSRPAGAYPHSLRRPLRSRPRPASSGIPAGNRIDEGLIVLGLEALRHGQRLPVGLGSKSRPPYVRHPDLDRAQSLSAQAFAMRAHLGAGGFGLRQCRHVRFSLGYM